MDIQVEGNVTIPSSAILKHVKTQTGRVATPNQIQEDVKQLWATGWFFGVKPAIRESERGLVLVFSVDERPVVRRVEFPGHRKIKRKHLDAWTGLKAGSPFDVNRNRNAARRIEQRYREKGFAFVKVVLASGGDPKDRDVVFRIEEGPKVRVVRRKFIGNDFGIAGRLRTRLETKAAILGLVGGIYNPETIDNDVASLRQYYQGLGFFDVKVEAAPKFSPNRSRVTMEYTIDEGVRYKIRNLQLVGNRVLSDQSLRRDFKLNAGDDFNVRFLNRDVSRMQDKYGELGRLYAKIDAVPRFLETPGTVDLEYRIDEDRVRRVRRINVHISGEYPHTRETAVRNRVLVHPGDLANAKLIQRSRTRLAGSRVFDSSPQGVRVDIQPVEETGVPFGRQALRGQHSDPPSRRTRSRPSTRTHSRPAVPNETVPPLRQPAFGLRQTTPSMSPPPFAVSTSYPVAPLISEASPTVIRGQTPPGPFQRYDDTNLGDPLGRALNQPPPGWVDLDWYVQEGRTGRLMFGVGVNSNAGVVGSIVVDESNFDILRPPRSFSDVIDGRAWRGGGQRFRMEAVPGNQVSRYMISWTDPFFLHTDNSLGVSGFFFTRFYPDWDEERVGGRISVGRLLSPEWSVSAALRLEDVELTDPRLPSPPELAAAVGNNFLSTLRVAANHDTRDSPIFASEGHFGELAFEQAFNDFDYSRVEGEYRQYFTMFCRPDGSGKQVLSVGGNAGWTERDTPIFEQYYAGGFNSFRGFSFRGVTPRTGGIATGGTWLFLGTAEYRVPLTADDMIQAVVFTDIGTVEDDVAFDQFRVVVGAGLRLTVPAMGPVPLAFDFGFPVKSQPFDDERVFSFYVGINR